MTPDGPADRSPFVAYPQGPRRTLDNGIAPIPPLPSLNEIYSPAARAARAAKAARPPDFNMQIHDELLALAMEAGLDWDVNLKGWIWAAAEDCSGALARRVRRILVRAVAWCRSKPDPLRAPLNGLPVPDWVVADAMAHGQPVGEWGFKLDELTLNVGVVGPVGAGKSWVLGDGLMVPVMERGRSAWAFDYHDDFVWTIKKFGPEQLLVFDVDKMPNNIMATTHDVESFARRVRAALNPVLYFGRGADADLQLAISKVRTAKEESGEPYDALDVFEAIEQEDHGKGFKGKSFRETLLSGLVQVIEEFGDLLTARQPLDMQKLLGRSVIFRMGKFNLGGAADALFINTMMIRIMHELEGTFSDVLRLFIILDEFHYSYTGRNKPKEDCGVLPVHIAFRIFRKTGTGFGVGCQTLAKFPDSAAANLRHKVIFGLESWACLQVAGNILGMNADAREELTRLDKREAVVRSPKPPKPFRVRVREFPAHDRPTEEEISERVAISHSIMGFDPPHPPKQVFIPGSRYFPPPLPKKAPDSPAASAAAQAPKPDPQPASAGKERLSHDEVLVLGSIAQSPHLTVPQRRKETGLSVFREHESRHRLLTLKIIREAGRIKGRMPLFEATEDSLPYLKDLKLTPKRYGKGAGLEHEAVRRLVSEAFSRLSRNTATFQEKDITFNGVELDLLVGLNASSANVGVQVCARNSARYECERALSAILSPHLAAVLVVATSKGKRDEIRRAVAEARPGQWPDKLVVMDDEAVDKAGRKPEGPWSWLRPFLSGETT